MAEQTLLERLEKLPPRPRAPKGGVLERLSVIERAEAVTGRPRPPEFETSPLPLPPEPESAVTDPAGPMVVEGLPETPKVIRTAAETGVLFDKPAPSGQALSSLAIDDENRIKAYQTSISKTLGQDVRVRRGPDTGEIEFLDPETNRFSLATPPGATLSRLETMAGESLVLLPELAAGGVAAALTKHPVFVNAAASAGAFAGEIARLSLGKRFGINEEATSEQIILEAAKTAGLSFVGGKLGDDVLRLGKFVFDAMSGRVLNGRVLEAAQIDIGEATKIADEINSVIGGEKFRFNLAQATNDTDLLSMQEFFKRSPEFQGLFREFGDSQQAAFSAYMKQIGLPFESRIADKAAAGKSVQDVANAMVGREKQRANIMVQMAEAEADEILTSTKVRPFESTGVDLREAVSVEQTAFREWADQQATSIDTMAGGAEFIVNRDTHAATAKLSSEARQALLPGQERQAQSLVGPEPDPDLPAEAIRKIFDPDAKFTFSELWDGVKFLKRLERVSAKGLSSEEPAVGSITFLRTAMERDLKRGVQETPLGETYDRFIKKYAQQKQRLDQGTVGAMMERRGGRNGRFVVADEKVFGTVFTPGGVRQSKELRSAIESNPASLDAMRESIIDFYRRRVAPEGRVSPALHRRFMSDYKDVLPVWFDKRDMSFFRKAGNTEKVLRAREEARETLTKRMRNTFEGQISDVRNPSQVLTAAWDPNDPSKMKRLVAMLSETKRAPDGGVFKPHADILRAVQSESRKEILERVAGEVRGGERVLSLPKMGDFLNGKGGEKGFAGVISELHGPKYVENLRTLHRALVIAGREPPSVNRSNTAFWQDTVKGLARAYVGLFTRPGRFITAIDRIRGRSANRAIVKAMVNPDQLSDLISMRGVNAQSRKAATLLGNLGASSFLLGDDGGN